MEAYAVIETGGKQYRVEKGDVLTVERLTADEGKEVNLDQVVALSNGSDLSVGTPTVKGATVKAKVVEHLRGSKLVSFKKKRRKGYKRKIGHRQELTKLEIVSLGAAEKKAKAAEAKDEGGENDGA
ncbi:MAG: 50S ribosomal protein L21 [Verrucomicrobia bacterium]|nr:50S ribosomal protein L21 [Verrucomicrobiota bacterium]